MTEPEKNYPQYDFDSKANVLEFLYPKLKNSKIKDYVIFSVNRWKENQKSVLDEIFNKFQNGFLVVRSSAVGEDSVDKSEAGKYESVLNVNVTYDSEIISAIEQVIDSYIHSDNNNPDNQILIQQQTTDIKLSGVIFSRTPDLGSPYYTINYDISSFTDSVTSGKINNVMKIFREITFLDTTHIFYKLIVAIKEIEDIFNSSQLDIEFGITNTDEIIIFQVRPLTTIDFVEVSDDKIKSLIELNQNKFRSSDTPNHMFGNTTLFSDMADWNPAEIIGNNPNLLDYSIYEFLIMNDSWHLGRSDIGYYDVKDKNLMTKFGNKPYVDVRSSFNSLLPDNIPNNLKEKLINFFLIKLQKYPHLHDKVEFEILFTCFDLNVPNRLVELKNTFSINEIKTIENSLITFTNNIISDFNNIYDVSIKNLKLLDTKRLEVISNLESTDNDYDDFLSASEKLLNDCKEYGTRIFSTLARIAFIANALLKSLNSLNDLDPQIVGSFMNSIRSPLSELRDDFDDFCHKKISKNQFLKKYGHLRPGTYDITTLRYDSGNSYFDNMKYLKKLENKKSVSEFEELDAVFLNTSLRFENIGFCDFVRKSTVQREKLKFEFTKNLSDALELLASAGKLLGFSREDMSNLDINFILTSYKTNSKDDLISLWKNKISQQKNNQKLNSLMVLPPIINSLNDFTIIEYFSTKPNFVTNLSISSDVVNIHNTDELIFEGKIVLIENADPGFDWIFTKNPAGLITKYGGVASHMSIRCAEIGLPAAIGCGEVLFEKLLKTTKVMLDCKHEQIVILENELSDEELEVKKTLKSIGYIK